MIMINITNKINIHAYAIASVPKPFLYAIIFLVIFPELQKYDKFQSSIIKTYTKTRNRTTTSVKG